MSKKSRKNSDHGTYALCITTGLIIGIGLGPLMGSVLIMALIGAGAGALAAYLIIQRTANRKRQR